MPLMVTVSVNQLSLSMEVDTGASYTIISKQSYDQFFSAYLLQSTDVRLKTYTREALPAYGQLISDVQYLGQKFCLELIVAGEEGPSLLGCNWLSSLRLVWNSILNLQDSRLDGLLSTYSSVFTEKLGTLKRFKARIYVSDHKPIFCKARPVPYAICSQVEVELDQLMHVKFIEPIPFSDWAAPIVPVMKPDQSIRICGDFKCTVNRVSKIYRYPNLASLLHPLYQLLGKSVLWSWTPERQAAFDSAKKLLTAANVLIHFDPRRTWFWHVMLQIMDLEQFCPIDFLTEQKGQ